MNKEKLWAPIILTPLSYLPSFQKLTEQQQKRYNQLFALGLLEQFIWFEEGLICPILQRVQQQIPMTAEMKASCRNFINEEIAHSEMFWDLLQKAEPQLYNKRQFLLLKISPWQNRILAMLKKFPNIFVAWSWLAVFFEERTLAFSVLYRKEQESLDPHFVDVHLRHMQDEIKHVQMDTDFIAAFFTPSAKWKQYLASHFMNKMLHAFASPHRVSRQILRQMRLEFSDFTEEFEGQFLQELKGIKYNRAYQKIAFGKRAAPRTRQMLQEHLSMARVRKFLASVD